MKPSSDANAHKADEFRHAYRSAAVSPHSSSRRPGNVHQWVPPAPLARSSSCRCQRWRLSHRRASERCLEQKRTQTHVSSQLFFIKSTTRALFFSVPHLSWCFLLCSAQISKLKSRRLCYSKCWVWILFWRHHCTAPVKPAQGDKAMVIERE